MIIAGQYHDFSVKKTNILYVITFTWRALPLLPNQYTHKHSVYLFYKSHILETTQKVSMKYREYILED